MRTEKKNNINHLLKNAKDVRFIGMGGNTVEVKARTLTGIQEEIGGFVTNKTRRDFSKIDSHGFYHYRSNLYEFAIQIVE